MQTSCDNCAHTETLSFTLFLYIHILNTYRPTEHGQATNGECCGGFRTTTAMVRRSFSLALYGRLRIFPIHHLFVHSLRLWPATTSAHRCIRNHHHHHHQSNSVSCPVQPTQTRTSCFFLGELFTRPWRYGRKAMTGPGLFVVCWFDKRQKKCEAIKLARFRRNNVRKDFICDIAWENSFVGFV